MSRREELQALLERVRVASSGNEDLDAEILLTLGILTRRNRLADCPDEAPIWEYHDGVRTASGGHHPMVWLVSTFIDAAIALVERVLPGWSWEVRRSGFGQPVQAILHDPMKQPAPGRDTRVDHESGCATLAILAALLSALIAKEGPADVQ